MKVIGIDIVRAAAKAWLAQGGIDPSKIIVDDRPLTDGTADLEFDEFFVQDEIQGIDEAFTGSDKFFDELIHRTKLYFASQTEDDQDRIAHVICIEEPRKTTHGSWHWRLTQVSQADSGTTSIWTESTRRSTMVTR